MSDFPKAEVIYRIRNAETRLYLERNLPTPATAFPTAQMRSEDVTSKRQHWRLTKVNDGPPVAYRIQNPYIAPNTPPIQALCYLASPTPNGTVTVARPLPASGTQHNTWTIVANTTNLDEKAFYLLPNDPQGATEPVLGNTIPSGTAAFVGFQAVERSTATTTNYLWQISEVSPAALEKEANFKYRIRAFLGKPLQVDASGNLNLDPTDARGDQRVWTIKDEGNGKCTVYSDRAQRYLTAMNVASPNGFDWRPTLRLKGDPAFSDSDMLWTFEKSTSLTHTIFINRRITVQNPTGPTIEPRDLALALDGNNAILKPKKLAHNEVWLVEPIDTPIGGLAGGGLSFGPLVTPESTGFPTGYFRIRAAGTPHYWTPRVFETHQDGNGISLWTLNTGTDSQVFFINSKGELCCGTGVMVDIFNNLPIITQNRPATQGQPNPWSHPPPRFSYSSDTKAITVKFYIDPVVSSQWPRPEAEWRDKDFVIAARSVLPTEPPSFQQYSMWAPSSSRAASRWTSRTGTGLRIEGNGTLNIGVELRTPAMADLERLKWDIEPA